MNAIPTYFRQPWALLMLTAVLACFPGSIAVAQDLPNSEDIRLTEKTSIPIHITYARPQGEGEKETPVVILLHGRRGNRLVWKQGLAQTLQQRGYAVVTVDLRKHGESKSADIAPARTTRTARPSADELGQADYARMVAQDLEAVKAFLLKEHQAEHLNMRKTAIIASDMSCVVAMHFASNDWLRKPYSDAPTVLASTPRGQDIRALILLSPESTLPGVNPASLSASVLRQFAVPVLICASKQDPLDKRGESKKLYTKLAVGSRAKERVIYYSVNGRFRGTDMVNKKSLKVDQVVVGFLEKHVKSLNGPHDVWRNRKSRLSN